MAWELVVSPWSLMRAMGSFESGLVSAGLVCAGAAGLADAWAGGRAPGFAAGGGGLGSWQAARTRAARRPMAKAVLAGNDGLTGRFPRMRLRWRMAANMRMGCSR